MRTSDIWMLRNRIGVVGSWKIHAVMDNKMSSIEYWDDICLRSNVNMPWVV